MVIGIFRCPYVQICGPNAEEFDYDSERVEVERTCFTRRHLRCQTYQVKQKEEQRRREIVISIVKDSLM